MKRRLWRFVLLTTTAIVTPTLAAADPVTATALIGTVVGSAIAGSATVAAAVGGTVIASILGAVASTAIGIGGQLLFGRNSDTGQQRQGRTAEFDPHPLFRFAFGEFPQGGRVVFHHVEGAVYYLVYLLSSIPIHGLTKIEMASGVELQIPGLRGVTEQATYNGNTVDQNIKDMSLGAGVQGPDPYGVSDEPDIKLWLGDGTHTQPPDQWRTEIGSVILATDIWKNVGCIFARIVDDNPKLAPDRYGQGRPPPFRFYGRWSKLYDPRRDGTSGVTGASGTHRIDDPATWEYLDGDIEVGANPALEWLMLATHTYALGFDQEMIPIQQIAEAADACGDAIGVLADTALYIALDVSGSMSGEKQEAQAEGVAALLTRIKAAADPDRPNDVRVVLSDDSFIERRNADADDYDALIAFAEGSDTASGDSNYADVVASAPTFFSGAGSKARLLVFTTDGEPVPTSSATDAATTLDGISDLSVHAFNIELADTQYTDLLDNTGGARVIDAASPGNLAVAFLDAVGLAYFDVFRGDGLVEIRERNFSLFDPVLACMAGHLDTTDGLLGLRAGVWEAPTVTLTQPLIGDGHEVAVDGTRDCGFDKVVAKLIARRLNFEEGDGPGYALREGSRTHPLHLGLVREDEQAARLEKIFGERAEPSRTVTGIWDGRESIRRIGERVTFGLPGFGRSTSTYMIESLGQVYRAEQDGFRIETALKLREDVEAAYTFTVADYTEADPADLPAVTPPTVTAPTIDAAQKDYRTVDGETHATLEITVTSTRSAGDVRVEYKTSGGGSYQHLAVRNGALTVVVALDPAVVGVTYTARARRENSAIGVSDWVESDPVTIVTPVLDFDPDDFNAEFA